MPIFTPLNQDGERLAFNPFTIEVLEGTIFTTGPGVHATVRIDGETFNVEGRPCGASARCYCDAQLVPVPETAAV